MNLQSVAQCIDWPIDRLIPYARSLTPSDSQIAQIAAIVKEFRFNNPILVDTHRRACR